MDDHQDPIRKEFSRKMDQARLDADHLARQAREIKKIMDDLAETSARSRGDSGGGPLKTEFSGQGVFGPTAFPLLLEDLERTLLEGEAWSGKLIGREGEFLSLLGYWEGLSGELAGLQASLAEALDGNATAWGRFTGFLRDAASVRSILKRDQEELAALLEETLAEVQQKEQGRNLLLELARLTLRQGEEKKDHLEEILANQKQTAELLEGCRRLAETSLAAYGEGTGRLQRFPDILQSFSGVIREMIQAVGDLYANPETSERTNPARIREDWPAPPRGEAGRSGPGTDAGTGEALTTAPFGCPAGWGEQRASLAALNERINLLALNAFIAAVQGQKKPEELAEVFGEIRLVSEQLKRELEPVEEAGPRPAAYAAASALPGGGPRPAETAGRVAGLLEHLNRMHEQNQELTLLAGEQARFAGRLLEGLLPLKRGLEQLGRLEADQAFQVREIQQSLERTHSQAEEVRRRLTDPGRGGTALVPRLESAREMVRTLAGDLLRRSQDEERLEKESARLRSLLDTVRQQVAVQGLKQLDGQETVDRVRRCHQKIRRELESRRLAIQGVLGRVRQLVDYLEPFARESREQSLMNRTFLEALTEIRGMVKNKLL